MPRKIPIPPEAQVTAEERPWRIPLKLVTPMLGGGHDPRHVDEVTPISAKAIRGHLRFWWRIMCAPDLVNPAGLHPTELMAIRESEVFGGQELGSPFDVIITDVQDANIEPNEGGSGADAYVFFPLRDRKAHGTVARAGLTFWLLLRWRADSEFQKHLEIEQKRRKKLRLDLPPFDLKTIKEHLRQSLWAWLHFGGIGSRTRRGLGSLEILSSAQGLYSFADKKGNARYSVHPDIYLSTRSFGQDDAHLAWHGALDAYREFRQGSRGPLHAKSILKKDRNPPYPFLADSLPKVQGRTKWPEPDSIRDVTGRALAPRTLFLKSGAVVPGPTAEQVVFNDHRSPSATGGNLPAYPRGILGLPIIFQFADGPNPVSDAVSIPRAERDPEQSTLVPLVRNANGFREPGDRMASPVITKPIFLRDRWHSAIILLHPPHIADLELVLKSSAGQTAITHAQVAGPAVSGFVPMRGKENALDALSAFIQTKGFTRYEEPR